MENIETRMEVNSVKFRPNAKFIQKYIGEINDVEKQNQLLN